MPNGDEGDLGVVKIDDEVLGTIAVIAAKKVPGVHRIATSFMGGIIQIFRKTPDVGVKVVVNEGEVSIDLGLIVDYGSNIPEVSWKVQKSIKEEIEKSCGLKVVKVNVVIEGVHHEGLEKGKEKGGTA
jgi:uncharacterized alkaline shock family protein YloU